MPQQRILIVDDNQQTRRSLVQIFRDEGYTVTSAGDRRPVGVLLTTDPPDLIVANAPPSSRHGLDMVRYIKQFFPHLPVLVIATSTTETTGQVFNCKGTTKRIKNRNHVDNLLDRIGLALTV
jgi:CheY-like chemotaxis protein